MASDADNLPDEIDFSSNLIKNKDSLPKRKAWICLQCGYTSLSAHGLSNHATKNHLKFEKITKCRVCNMRFSHAQECREHEKRFEDTLISNLTSFRRSSISMSDAKKFLEGKISTDKFLEIDQTLNLKTIAGEIEEHIARNVRELGLAGRIDLGSGLRAEIPVDTVDAREMTVVVEAKERSGTFVVSIEENGTKIGESKVIDDQASMQEVKNKVDQVVDSVF